MFIIWGGEAFTPGFGNVFETQGTLLKLKDGQLRAVVKIKKKLQLYTPHKYYF